MAPFYVGTLTGLLRGLGLKGGDAARTFVSELRKTEHVDVHSSVLGQMVISLDRNARTWPRLGQRVRFRRDADRYPWCSIPAGLVCVVDHIDRRAMMITACPLHEQATERLKRQSALVSRELAHWDGAIEWHGEAPDGSLLDWFWTEVERC